MKKIVSLILVSVLLVCLLPCSFAEELYNVYLDIDFVGNLIFSTYDVNVFIDNRSIGTIAHGKYFTKLVPEIEDGSHTLSFYRVGNSSVNGSVDFTVHSDSTVAAKIYAYSDKISISDFKLSNNVDSANLIMPDAYLHYLSTAISGLKNTGFINISAVSDDGSSIWDNNNWIVIEQNFQAGTTHDKNDAIKLTCRSVSKFLEDNFFGKNMNEAKKLAEAMQFSVKYIFPLNSKDLSDVLSNALESEMNQWVVCTESSTSASSRSITLGMIYTGDVEVPSLEGMNLSDAYNLLVERSFSNIDEKTTDSSTIWARSNWTVLSQSMPVGSIMKADEKLTLTCYKPEKNSSTSYGSNASEHESDSESLPPIIVDNQVEIKTSTTELSQTGESVSKEDATTTPYTELSKGDFGELVVELQMKLVEQGYNTNGVDGSYGDGTEAAVRGFQAANGLEVTGIADQETLSLLYTGKKAETPPASPAPTSSPTASSKKENSLYYTTNDKDTAKQGNSGVFAYSRSGRNYDQYCIIDFDEGYVYCFNEGNGDDVGERVKIVSGDLNKGLKITYHDGDSTWSYWLHFKWQRQPDQLVFVDEDKYEWDYICEGLDTALRLRDSKRMIDY